jgi:nucleotide-binding universal stress UspA family protein
MGLAHTELRADNAGRRIELRAVPRAVRSTQSIVTKDRSFDILVPVDGSPGAERAVRFVIGLYPRLAPLRVRLLGVQLPDALVHEAMPDDASAHAAAPVNVDDALRVAQSLLTAAGVPHVAESRTGHVPQAIAQHARETGCFAIVMGTRGMGTTDHVLGSIARQVINLVDISVTLVK